MSRNFKIREPDWSAAFWARVKSMFGGLDTRVTALEQGGGGGVTGVKGDAESTYRTGNVNLTPANLGAQVDVGLYIDAQGYLCQQISSDT